MSYRAVVLADSVSPAGVRLTTVEATFPRFILAEWNTHRVFGRSSASSRAVPPEAIIQRVVDDPFVPEFNRRVRGMGFGDELEIDAARHARQAWLNARDKAVQAALVLVDLDVDKARVNRLLEPFMWHTCITTATEWSNFLALRQPSDDGPVPRQDFPAQPEFQVVARMVRDAMRDSKPALLDYGQWHLPLVTDQERASVNWLQAAKISAGRCARVSFDKHDEHEHWERSLERFGRLASMGHWSPMEHCARPIAAEDDTVGVVPALERKLLGPQGGWGWLTESRLFCGHLRGWVCLRKTYENEHDRSVAADDRDVSCSS